MCIYLYITFFLKWEEDSGYHAFAHHLDVVWATGCTIYNHNRNRNISTDKFEHDDYDE